MQSQKTLVNVRALLQWVSLWCKSLGTIAEVGSRQVDAGGMFWTESTLFTFIHVVAFVPSVSDESRITGTLERSECILTTCHQMTRVIQAFIFILKLTVGSGESVVTVTHG